MSATSAVDLRSLPATSPALPIRLARLHARLLVEVSICVVPSMTLVGIGMLYAASRWLFVTMILFIIYHFMTRKPVEALALTVALVPATMLLRGAFYYSAPIVIAMAVVGMQITVSQQEFLSVKTNRLLVGLVSCTAVYWWVSFALTGTYSSNMRVLELSFVAASVYLLGNHRSYLATALIGMSFAILCVALALLPYGDRLGQGQVEDLSIGNPIALGLSATLILLLAIVDRGQWLFVERNPVWQAVVAMLAALCLALSTSRGSWLVTLVGLAAILLFNKHSRKLLLGTVLLATIAIAILLQTERGPIIQHYFNNVAAADKTLAKRTTGRADQWESFPRVFWDSPVWGFGPGSGKTVSLKYTKEGKPWHALYLLVGTETGLMGLVSLALFLSALARRGFLHWRLCGELAPLLTLVCFMIIGVSVSGIDAISGVFLGFAFLGNDSLMIRLRLLPDQAKLLNQR